MSEAPPPEPAAASFGWALRLGARAAISSVLPALALAGVFATTQVVWHTLATTLLLAEPALRLEGTLLLSGVALLVLASMTRAIVLAVAVHSGAVRLRTGSSALSPARAGLRGIAWAAMAVVVDQLLSAWFWGVLLASGAATVLGGPLLSLLGATGVALVLTAGAFVFPAAALWLELGLVAAVARPARLAEAARTALGTLLARPGAVVGLWAVTALPAGFLAAAVQALRSAAAGPGWAAASAGGVAILLVSLVEAVATLIRLDALAALVLDGRGQLPAPPPLPPPPPPAIPVASLVARGDVLEARPVGAVAPWSPGGPG
ncbi:MAG TPA: hypothetical protein VGF31_15340 [Myxococcaceae bacterium]